MAPPISVGTVRTYELSLVTEVENGQYRPFLDKTEIITYNIAAIDMNTQHIDGIKMHHGWYPSCILPLDLMILLKILKWNMNT